MKEIAIKLTESQIKTLLTADQFSKEQLHVICLMLIDENQTIKPEAIQTINSELNPLKTLPNDLKIDSEIIPDIEEINTSKPITDKYLTRRKYPNELLYKILIYKIDNQCSTYKACEAIGVKLYNINARLNPIMKAYKANDSKVIQTIEQIRNPLKSLPNTLKIDSSYEVDLQAIRERIKATYSYYWQKWPPITRLEAERHDFSVKRMKEIRDMANTLSVKEASQHYGLTNSMIMRVCSTLRYNKNKIAKNKTNKNAVV